MTEQIVPLFRKALVVGQHFIKDDEGKEALTTLDSCLGVNVVHDTENEYDHYAASVRIGTTHVGYISADISPVICLLINSGHQVIGEVIETEVNKAKNYTVSLSTKVNG